jgi:AraC family transcriptional regulator of adaptative response / DNA-3-methyladenine glycosylase II
MPGAEEIEGGVYRRTVRIGDSHGWIEVGPPNGTLPIVVAPSLLRVLVPLLARVRSLLDLDAEPARIAAHLGADETLGDRLEKHPGLRVPGAFDGFELASRAILGQQVSVAGATTLAARVVAELGEAIETPYPKLNRLSPTPAAVVRAGAAALARLGIMPARAQSLAALAAAMAGGDLRLEPGADPDAALEKLAEIPGIGPWTAEVILMRALRFPDAFPHADLGIRRALGGASARATLTAAEAWRPFRAYAAQLLWETS